ncbi:MAG: hypothetical protein IJY96_07470 [Oscillospiraceae bacterium]|nr:hypothetical protein [Oscillospiraceae bacterium]
MKIRRILVLFMMFALALSFAAFADVAYEPRDNFYDKHRSECEYENRTWITNGAEGYVVGYSSPTGSASEVFPNGREYYVSYTWLDGEALWGCIEYDPASLESAWRDAESAWVDMSAMVPRYDSRAFMEEHADELLDEERILVPEPDAEVQAYLYPGSGIVVTALPSGSDIRLGNIYTDAEGREWGRIGYHYGIRDVWVCIDDASAALPAGDEFTEREIIPAADDSAMKKALNESSGLSANVLVGAVGAVVIAGAIIAYIIIRKRRAE